MSQQIKNVAIAGYGKRRFEDLTGPHRLWQIRRHCHRSEPSPSLPSDVKVKVVDFGSSEALFDAFKGQDAVIDVTMSPDAAMPLRMIEAAVEAGVKRFIPSEFSLDPQNAAARAVPVYMFKNQVIDRLKELAAANKITFTSISNGAFLDWNLRTGFFKIDLKNKKAELLNGGSVVIPWTLLEQVGKAVVGVLLHLKETKNRFVYISNVEKTQKEMVALAQEALRKDGWDVSTLDMDKVYRGSLAQLQAGNATFEVMGDMILYCNSKPEFVGPWVKNDNALLGLEAFSDERIKELIKSIASE
ncbi:isoflavone reductase family [Fusarium albosuccineum]|uniref:Isoflavone reductase family n=1 Tax=Fusarium albosuccineum TaxID=1237068 RepID=A0A8H4L5E0_9HYPO|nr:isoflavone reductase family [Fusarium albosuccineum]